MVECKEEKKSEEISRHRFSSIYVLSGSNLGKDRDFIKVSNNLGKVLAIRNINLMYRRGIYYLRGYVTTSTFIESSKVLGYPSKGFN